MLTYKGRMVKNEKSFEELMKETVYLTSMLEQKEGQLEEAERHWKKQFEQMVEQVTQSDEDDNASIPFGPLPPFSAPPLNTEVSIGGVCEA